MNTTRYIGRTRWDKARFAISVCMDIVGSGSYLGYLFGPGAAVSEGTDVFFAPVQALWIMLAYQRWDSIPTAIFGGLEELMPGTDGIPTCTLYHLYTMRQKYGESAAAPQLP